MTQTAQTREALVEVMARAMCVYQDQEPDRELESKDKHGNPVIMWTHWKRDAEAALLALEAAGVRLVPKQASDVRSKKWTDDDQCALNAAVYDAMWHWEDAPIDVDDAMNLASTFKAKLEENGLTIVALPLRKGQDQ